MIMKKYFCEKCIHKKVCRYINDMAKCWEQIERLSEYDEYDYDGPMLPENIRYSLECEHYV